MCVQERKIYGLWKQFVSVEVIILVEGECLGMKGLRSLATKSSLSYGAASTGSKELSSKSFWAKRVMALEWDLFGVSTHGHQLVPHQCLQEFSCL